MTRGGKNTDEAWGVATDSQGNIYWLTHQTVPGPFADIYLYKLSPDGDEIWKSKWGGALNEQAYIVVVKEPFVYVAGTTWNGIWLNSVDMAVIAFSVSDGNVVWDFTWDQGFGYEEVDGLVVEADGIYLAGWTTGEHSGNDLAILKLSSDGKLIWSQTWGSPNWDEGNGHIVVDAENVYVAGRYNSPGPVFGGDALLAAFRRSTGAYLWHRTWGGDGTDDAFGMTGDATSLYTVGITDSFGHGSIFLLKYDLKGNLIWERTWSGEGSQAARAIALTLDGCVLVGGKTDSYGAGQNDVVLLKFTADGILLWYKTWGGAATDEAHEIAIQGDIVYIAGETYSYGSGKSDALLIKANIDVQSASDIVMDTDWNLISLPLQPAGTSIDPVLSSIAGKYDSVWRYDSNPGWRWYLPDNPGASNLFEMESGIGYWIMINESCSLTVQGTQPDTAIPLVADWNLVGYCSQTQENIEDCMSSIVGKYSSVWEYDPELGWRWYLPGAPGASNLSRMKVGRGYWILATQVCTWDIDTGPSP